MGRFSFRDPSGSQNLILCRASVCIPIWGWRMSLDIKQLIAAREVERYQLHASHLNEQMVHVLKTIGFDKRYQRGVGQYLYDEQGERYLDLLSGWGVFAIGRNHPTVREALNAVLDSELPEPCADGRVGTLRYSGRAPVGIRASSRQGILFQFRD